MSIPARAGFMLDADVFRSLPGTRSDRFHLHECGLLSEYERWTNGDGTTFFDPPHGRWAVEFKTPPQAV